MRQNEIFKMAVEAGLYQDCHVWFSTSCINESDVTTWDLIRFAELVSAKAAKDEQDRCCSIIFGQCESDNVAQRMVDAIRKTG